ncbi:hypothetical protein [Xenorhabdus sp. KJ12.1]|uniref:hypothetical protein n=1 Tax=Xenorhabdus sp. KJ12.1 TaxID=1851571 RepID=UPI00187CC024|nr:hypothetical protein [Xenorhabdus sp. KJ12.1]
MVRDLQPCGHFTGSDISTSVPAFAFSMGIQAGEVSTSPDECPGIANPVWIATININ